MIVFLKPLIYQNDNEGFFDKCLNLEQQATNLFHTWIYHLRHTDYCGFVP